MPEYLDRKSNKADPDTAKREMEAAAEYWRSLIARNGGTSLVGISVVCIDSRKGEYGVRIGLRVSTDTEAFKNFAKKMGWKR